ncbi:hypothetical protein FKM82_014650 [Ascaphus truei]
MKKAALCLICYNVQFVVLERLQLIVQLVHCAGSIINSFGAEGACSAMQNSINLFYPEKSVTGTNKRCIINSERQALKGLTSSISRDLQRTLT